MNFPGTQNKCWRTKWGGYQNAAFKGGGAFVFNAAIPLIFSGHLILISSVYMKLYKCQHENVVKSHSFTSIVSVPHTTI